MIHKLYVDFDGTMVNTIKTMVELYNSDYRKFDGFKWIDWFLVNTWDFKECSIAPKWYFDLQFNAERLFEQLEFIDNQEEVFWYVIDEYFGCDHTTVVSMGQKPNLKLKESYLEQYFYGIPLIGLDIDEYKDKSSVDMSDGIFIDDSAENLRNSNAAIKICFGRTYPWNEDWDGVRCKDWYEVARYLKVLEHLQSIEKRKVVEESVSN